MSEVVRHRQRFIGPIKPPRDIFDYCSLDTIPRLVHRVATGNGRTGGKKPRVGQGRGMGEGAGEARGEGEKPSQQGGQYPSASDEGGRTTGI